MEIKLNTKCNDILVVRSGMTELTGFSNGEILGIHKTCGGDIHVRTVTETHKVITCHRCLMRIDFPKEKEQREITRIIHLQEYFESPEKEEDIPGKEC